MTSSIPNGFSMDDLHSLMETAPKEEEVKATRDCGCDDSDEPCQHETEKAAEAALDLASELCEGPLVHKVMAVEIITRMVQWHTVMGQKEFAEGNEECGTAWLRDAGKFQSMLDSLMNITVGPDDFLCVHNQ